ncbi:hypothetical protein [Niallia sp. 03133]|uniref:hypothetical protein n=1 Tax=Niallia sp. 03133 TaxID=3458060 RepID=UPI0040446FC7
MKTHDDTIVRFSTEITSELAEKHRMNVEAVNTTCKRVRKHLFDCSYLSTEDKKSHRVKKTRDGGWITGERAFMYDKQARAQWASFINYKLALYKEIYPSAEKIPMHIFRAEIKKVYLTDMARWLDVEYYRTVHHTCVTNNLKADIDYARQAFLETHNLVLVREELAHKQQQYK